MVKILLVDDEFRIRKVIRDFLSAKGYSVLEAVDGEQAVDEFMSHKDVDLVILDVMLPKMDGWEVCRSIRAYSTVPIVMLTAKGEENDEPSYSKAHVAYENRVRLRNNRHRALRHIGAA